MRRTLAFLASLLLLPSAGFAQASIVGVVKDTSGGVLPGVTIEASSPALIEKTRSVVTDDTGQYKIVDLRPGTYTVTFTLAGFNTVKREGIELAGSFSAPINVELTVGALEEAITVSGASPVVDVQTVKAQRVISKDALDALPTNRMASGLTVLIPGVNLTTLDLGGTNTTLTPARATIHGGRTDDSRPGLVEGLSAANSEGAGWSTATLINAASVQEITVDYAATSAENQVGGVQTNVIPRQGGNKYTGSFFANTTNSNLIDDNLTQDLINRGLKSTSSVKHIYDINPSFGGPLVKDKVWFYTAAHWLSQDAWVAGGAYNLYRNATTLPQSWLYAPDPSAPRVYTDRTARSYNGRVTWQADPKNKFSVYYDDQFNVGRPFNTATTAADVGAPDSGYPMSRFVTATWSSPLTSRLLLEMGYSNHGEGWHRKYVSDFDTTQIPVTEQSNGILYHASDTSNFNTQFPNFRSNNNFVRAAASYITGAHAFKFGFTDGWASRRLNLTDNDFGLHYRFNNGVPNQILQVAAPFDLPTNLKADLGIYAQDRWTMSRLTLNLGARFDYFSSYYPESHLGPTYLTPTRDVTFPSGPLIDGWKDIVPRLGASYDLFGDGKTALKVTLNKYVLGSSIGDGAVTNGMDPVVTMPSSATRVWTDANRDYVPNCDLRNPQANGECGVVSDLNFGLPIASTTYDPNVVSGWGHRQYNWEFSTSVQREILPRVSVNAGYFRRWYGNFITLNPGGIGGFPAHNIAVTAADYTQFSITAPVDPRLPNGGGYVISGLYDLNPNKVGQVRNYVTFTAPYGKQLEHWNGIDLTMNARPSSGVVLEGGMSTGRTLTDNCAVLAAIPDIGPLAGPYCHNETNFLTQLKFVGVYTVPKVDVQVSGVFMSLPGPSLLANYVATNAVVAPSLGRNLSGGSNVTVNLIEPGTMFGDRLNDFDLRFGKLVRWKNTRSLFSIDIYNVFNASPVTAENSNFASWRVPQGILTARFAKLSVQFDF